MTDVLSRCRRVLRSLSCVDVVVVGSEYPEIFTKTTASWAGWGEAIHVQCYPVHDGVVEVHIRSRPRLRIGIIDKGKNLSNVEFFLARIEGGADPVPAS